MENRILHVEDNSDDVLLTALAFRKAGVQLRIDVAIDGAKAIAKLQSQVGSPPVCVLLDVKLPCISGFEVLTWIRAHPFLKRLPVIMFTSSLLPQDINRAYDLGANSYLTKPSDLDLLIELARAIDHYWVRTNTQPPPASALSEATPLAATLS